MSRQSALSETIDTADQEAQYDASVKRLLSQKIILAWILKECVNEFKSFSISQIIGCIDGDPQVAVVAVDADELDYIEETTDTQIEGLNTEDVSINEGKVYYDIRFLAVVPGTKEPVHLIINVEAQKSDKTSYPLIKRAIYYVSRMVSAQKNKVFTGSHYEKMRKVYSIWIQMNAGTKKANTITRYRIAEEQIVGDVPEKESNYDLLTVMMLRLGAAEKAKDKTILRLLDVLLSSETSPEDKKAILEKDFDIPMSKEMTEEANIMCNLGEGIRERTELKTKADDIIRVSQAMNVSIDRAMEILGVDKSKVNDFQEIIDSQMFIVR